MAKTKYGVPTQGHIGGWSYFEREGEGFVRIGKNLVAKDRPLTRGRAEQLSKMSNLIRVWRSFQKQLKGCFENRKPAATDYSGFLAANLPWARVFLPKAPEELETSLADNFYVSYGTLAPAIEVEESGEWMLSDIRVGDRPLTGENQLIDLAKSIVYYNDGIFQWGDEIQFVRMKQSMVLNFGQPQVSTWLARFELAPGTTYNVAQSTQRVGEYDGFQIVEGRLAARRREGELVAWIRRRRDREGRMHVTTQRLVGSNPMLMKYIGQEALERAVDSYRLTTRYWQPLKVPQVEIAASSNDVKLGVVEGGGSYAPGAPVTLKAVAKEGGRFLVWDDGCQDAVRQLAALQSGAYKAIFVRE